MKLNVRRTPESTRCVVRIVSLRDSESQYAVATPAPTPAWNLSLSAPSRSNEPVCLTAPSIPDIVMRVPSDNGILARSVTESVLSYAG